MAVATGCLALATLALAVATLIVGPSQIVASLLGRSPSPAPSPGNSTPAPAAPTSTTPSLPPRLPTPSTPTPSLSPSAPPFRTTWQCGKYSISMQEVVQTDDRLLLTARLVATGQTRFFSGPRFFPSSSFLIVNGERLPAVDGAVAGGDQRRRTGEVYLVKGEQATITMEFALPAARLATAEWHLRLVYSIPSECVLDGIQL